MLHPTDRSLYTDALTPPRGYVFDQAIGTTYTLDPTTMLMIPVHLGLAAWGKGGEKNPVDLLGALNCVADRITVYAQRGRVQAPDGGEVLFSQLESMIVEAASPGNGAFHPKVWVLRFKDAESGGPVFRLLVLSRNLTADRAWDLCLQLEGRPGGKSRAANKPLCEFIRNLPSLAVDAVAGGKRKQAEELAAEIARVKWDVPEGFDDVRFHFIRDKAWHPAKSDRLAVISPFVSGPALEALARTTGRAEILISRAEELDGLERSPDEMSGFHQVSVLDDAAEAADDDGLAGHDMYGLHAKVILAETKDKIRIYTGSANATISALVSGRSIEFFAELIGYGAGGIDALLGEEGLGEFIRSWTPDEGPGPDPKKKEAEEILDRVREALAKARLRVRHIEDAHSGKWQIELCGDTRVDVGGIQRLRAWPITVRDTHAADILDSMGEETINLGAYSLQSVTGLIAFEIKSELQEAKEVRFTLNLPLDALPEGRDAAILQTVLNNRSGFLRYLLLLLGDFGEGWGRSIVGTGWGMGGQGTDGGEDMLPLLEEMTRAFSRDPARLREIRGIVERLDSVAGSDDLVPEDFRALWATFEKALGGRQQ